jgi:hypothetical protein
MPASPNRFVVGALAAFALVAAAAALPAEAKKAPKFASVFVAKLPGEPKGATSWKATTKGPLGAGTGYVYTDATGSLTLSGFASKPGLTTVTVLMNVNVFGGMDLTNVTFPVTRPALVVLSYTKTTIKLSDPTHPKILAYNYSSDVTQGATVTVTSYDPVKNEMKGTLDGTLSYHQNEQDPKDDARDGKVVTLKNAKFALKPVGP